MKWLKFRAELPPFFIAFLYIFGDIGAKTFLASVSSTEKSGLIELHLESPEGTLIGILTVASIFYPASKKIA
jgi:hypothetical protein